MELKSPTPTRVDDTEPTVSKHWKTLLLYYYITTTTATAAAAAATTTSTTTTTVLWPFVQEYPGESVPEG